MSPWTILEWVLAVGLSVVIVVAVIFGISLGIRYLMNATSNKFGAKRVIRKPATKTTK